MTQTCGTCRYSEEWIPGDDEEPARLICGFPRELMPLSMQGVAQRERETVLETATDCPTFQEIPT